MKKLLVKITKLYKNPSNILHRMGVMDLPWKELTYHCMNSTFKNTLVQSVSNIKLANAVSAVKGVEEEVVMKKKMNKMSQTETSLYKIYAKYFINEPSNMFLYRNPIRKH
jgi:hypothetical protein